MLYQVVTGHGISKRIVKTFASLIDANRYARNVADAYVETATWQGPVFS